MSAPLPQCAACRRDAPERLLEQIPSVLDFRLYPTCPACIDQNAEPMLAVVRTVNTAGWCALPKEIRDAVRVFDMGEYVTVGEWARRMSTRQLVPCPPAEPELPPDDEAVFQRVMEKMRELSLPRPVRERRLRNVLFDWMLTIFGWRTA